MGSFQNFCRRERTFSLCSNQPTTFSFIMADKVEVSNGTDAVNEQKFAEAAADSVEESSQDESDVHLSVDEASDSENYKPPAQDVSSDEISSGDDEGDFEVEEKKDGECKLKYKDIEEYRNKTRINSSEA